MQKKIITFYSYKGGVGRTMALANAACQLATKHGLNVIAVDWDLEAPGLHYYFDYTDQELKNKPGLIDYLSDFVNEVKKGNLGKVPDINNYLTKPKLHTSKKIKNGSVTLLTCGMTNQSYMSRVQDFNWAQFYEKYEGYQIIETLKKQLLDISDVALIDSRAGQADISSTSTIQIPDVILFFFTSNKQSVDGTANLARKLKQHPFRINQGFEDIRMLMIPSRVFSEDDRFDHWLKSVANPIFEGLVNTGIITKEDQPKGLKQCILGIEPRFTFKEELPVLDDTYTQSSLKLSYEQLAYAITDLLEGRKLWSSQRIYPAQLSLHDKSTPTISYTRSIEVDGDVVDAVEKLRSDLSAASDRGDDHRSAYLRYKLGQTLVVLDKLEEAEVLLEASLTYNKSKGFLDAVSTIEYSIGNLKLRTKNYKTAIKHFNESLNLDKILKNYAGVSSALYQIGIAKHGESLYDEAIISFKNALKYAIKLNDTHLEGQIYNAIAIAYFAKGNYTQAFNNLLRLSNLSEVTKDEFQASLAFLALGIVSQAQKRYQQALDFLQKSMIKSKSIKDYNGLMICYDLIGDVYLAIKDNEKAIFNYVKAVETAKKYCSVSDLISSLLNLSEGYYSTGNIKLAKKIVEKASKAATSIDDDAITKKIRELKTKYDKFTG